MSDSKNFCIAACLTEHFPGAKIKQKHDFNLRAQSFKVHLSDDSFLVTVSDEFVGDHDEPRIAALLNQRGGAAILKSNSDQTVLSTTDCPQAMWRP